MSLEDDHALITRGELRRLADLCETWDPSGAGEPAELAGMRSQDARPARLFQHLGITCQRVEPVGVDDHRLRQATIQVRDQTIDVGRLSEARSERDNGRFIGERGKRRFVGAVALDVNLAQIVFPQTERHH